MPEEQTRRGCDLALFCVVNKALDRRWPGKLYEANVINEILDLLGQVEQKFQSLPDAPKKTRRKAAATK